MFRRRLAATIATALAAVMLAVPPASAQQLPAETRIFISVTGDDGKVATVLKQDITVTEDGQAREVLSLERAEEPVHIALLVDDSQAAQSAIAEMRTGLTRFVQSVLAASPASEIALVTFGERPTLLVDYTSDLQQLERGITRIFARPGSGAYMLEAIVSATRGIEKRELVRPHLIVVGTEGIEFSNDSYTRVLEGLADSGASLWALTLTSGPRADDNNEEVRNRAIVLGRGTAESGGRQFQVLANSAIGVRLTTVADLVLNQYAVTFARPDALVPPDKLTITVSLPGAQVLAPSFAPRIRTAGDAR